MSSVSTAQCCPGSSGHTGDRSAVGTDQRPLEEKPMPKVSNLTGMGRRPNEVGPNEVYIGRHIQTGWRKSKWGNPFRLPRNASREHRAETVAMYRHGCWGNPR